MTGSRLRVLVATNHLRWYGGSEIVAYQVAQAFAAAGDEVTIATNVIGAPMNQHLAPFKVVDDVSGLALADFDLVWCQHDMLSRLPLAGLVEASRGNLPHVAYVSLSAHHPYEHLNGLMARALSADVYANSQETAATVVRDNAGIIKPDDIRIFHNGTPTAFWRPVTQPPPEPELRSLLLVSNHPPDEVLGCVELLKERGVSVRRIGLGGEITFVGPEDLEAVDAVMAIGKTVTYALAMNKPVFIYDFFGGDGWLTRETFPLNSRFNFSGRPNQRRLASEPLADEVMDGFAAAATETALLPTAFDLSSYRLDHHISALRKRAHARDHGLRGSWRRAILRRSLSNTVVKAHLETIRRKAEVAGFFHRQADYYA